MIKEIIERIWTPVLGAMSTISFKGITDILSDSSVIDSAEWVTSEAIKAPEHSLLTYFWIGMLGALGGLTVRILWGLCVYIWPKIKNFYK